MGDFKGNAMQAFFKKSKKKEARAEVELRPGSKWRVAKKVLNLMDSNRASSEKQDMADIVKMFQRLNARKIFENWEPDRELRDIQSDLHTVNAGQSFCGIDEARSNLAKHQYDSIEISDDVRGDLETQGGFYKGHLERMDSSNLFADLNKDSLENIQSDSKFTRVDSQKLVGDVDTSSLFDNLSLQ